MATALKPLLGNAICGVGIHLQETFWIKFMYLFVWYLHENGICPTNGQWLSVQMKLFRSETFRQGFAVLFIFYHFYTLVPIMRQPRNQPPPRPHSADFLEYEASRRPDQQSSNSSGNCSNQQRRPQRPKSSLDVVNSADVPPAGDGYFYSEERQVIESTYGSVRRWTNWSVFYYFRSIKEINFFKFIRNGVAIMRRKNV